MGSVLGFPTLIAISTMFAFAVPAFAAEYFDTTALPQGVSVITTLPNVPTVDVTGLPPGCHLASAQEAASAQNLQEGVSLVCPADELLGINPDVGAAKEYLRSLTSDLRNSCAPPTRPENIQRLDDGFAICAAAFFKEYQKQYGRINIVSAYRDAASGANQCAGGVSGSNHTRGLAMDINPVAGAGSSYPTLWAFASANPQYGVCFPFKNIPFGGHPHGDPPHMILAGIGGSEGGRCAAQGVTKHCEAGARFVVVKPIVGPELPDTIGGGSIFNPGGGTFGGGGATGSWLMQAVQPLASLLRGQQSLSSQFPTQPTAPPATITPLPPETGKGPGDVFKLPTTSTGVPNQWAPPPPFFPPVSFPPASYPTTSFPSTTRKIFPTFFEDILGEISVSAPRRTTEPPPPPPPTAHTDELTQEEFERLQDEQSVWDEPDSPSTVVVNYEPPQTPQQTFPANPFAGFVPPRLEEEPSQAFLQMYIDALNKVSAALSQIYRFLTAPPQY